MRGTRLERGLLVRGLEGVNGARRAVGEAIRLTLLVVPGLADAPRVVGRQDRGHAGVVARAAPGLLLEVHHGARAACPDCSAGLHRARTARLALECEPSAAYPKLGSHWQSSWRAPPTSAEACAWHVVHAGSVVPFVLKKESAPHGSQLLLPRTALKLHLSCAVK